MRTVHPSVRPSIHPSIHPSVRPSIHPSIHPPNMTHTVKQLTLQAEPTHSSVVYIGMSLGISFSPLAEQSTKVPSHEQPLGHALSIRHSPARRVRNSSTPAAKTQWLHRTSRYVPYYWHKQIPLPQQHLGTKKLSQNLYFSMRRPSFNTPASRYS